MRPKPTISSKPITTALIGAICLLLHGATAQVQDSVGRTANQIGVARRLNGRNPILSNDNVPYITRSPSRRMNINNADQSMAPSARDSVYDEPKGYYDELPNTGPQSATLNGPTAEQVLIKEKLLDLLDKATGADPKEAESNKYRLEQAIKLLNPDKLPADLLRGLLDDAADGRIDDQNYLDLLHDLPPEDFMAPAAAAPPEPEPEVRPQPTRTPVTMPVSMPAPAPELVRVPVPVPMAEPKPETRLVEAGNPPRLVPVELAPEDGPSVAPIGYEVEDGAELDDESLFEQVRDQLDDRLNRITDLLYFRAEYMNQLLQINECTELTPLEAQFKRMILCNSDEQFCNQPACPEPLQVRAAPGPVLPVGRAAMHKPAGSSLAIRDASPPVLEQRRPPLKPMAAPPGGRTLQASLDDSSEYERARTPDGAPVPDKLSNNMLRNNNGPPQQRYAPQLQQRQQQQQQQQQQLQQQQQQRLAAGSRGNLAGFVAPLSDGAATLGRAASPSTSWQAGMMQPSMSVVSALPSTSPAQQMQQPQMTSRAQLSRQAADNGLALGSGSSRAQSARPQRQQQAQAQAQPPRQAPGAGGQVSLFEQARSPPPQQPQPQQPQQQQQWRRSPAPRSAAPPTSGVVQQPSAQPSGGVGGGGGGDGVGDGLELRTEPSFAAPSRQQRRQQQQQPGPMTMRRLMGRAG